jgi:hypothetical protein
MGGHQGMRADFYGDESPSKKSKSSEGARTERGPETRLEQFKRSTPHFQSNQNAMFARFAMPPDSKRRSLNFD